MTTIHPCELPETALLRAYQDEGAYTDGYVIEVDGPVSQPVFIEAFYTTALFKVERALLRYLAGRPSSDDDARKLAEGTSDSFAAWRVEGRNDHQLLLCDFTGRTRSWLMVAATRGPTGEVRSSLYFGSAVVPRTSAGASGSRLGFMFHALLGFHRLYSKLLLSAARSRILARRRAESS